MPRILLAFDGLHYSESAQRYAIEWASQGKWHLSGLFLDDPTHTGFAIYSAVTEDGVSTSQLSKFTREDERKRQAAAARFEQACRQAHVGFEVHHPTQHALDVLLQESLYADLLIVQSDLQFMHHEEAFPSRFVSQVLSRSQCPVLLVPPAYVQVDAFLLLFDGTAESFQSFKSFSCVFSAFAHMPHELISIKTVGGSKHLENHRSVKLWCHQHFPHTHIEVSEGLPQVELDAYMTSAHRNYLCVTAAYGRSSVSRWFSESMADHLHRTFSIPVFVQHPYKH